MIGQDFNEILRPIGKETSRIFMHTWFADNFDDPRKIVKEYINSIIK